MTYKEYKAIEVGNTLVLLDAGDEKTIIKEKVTHVTNPVEDNEIFQVRTERLGYDFLNFYDVLEIIK